MVVESDSKLPRRIELGIYEEVVGEIKETKVVGEFLTILIKIAPRLLEVEFPRESLYGELPPPGSIVDLLRTRTDYRIKVESDE